MVKSTNIILLVSKQKSRIITCTYRHTDMHTDVYTQRDTDTQNPGKTEFKLSLGLRYILSICSAISTICVPENLKNSATSSPPPFKNP